MLNLTRHSIATTAMTALTLACAVAAPGWAQERDDRNAPYSLGVAVGGEYSSNITVDAQDLSTNEGDIAAVIEANLGYKPVDDGVTSLEIGYDFYQSLYEDLSDFDLQIHGLSLSGATKWAEVDVSGAYRFNHIRLGGDKFLNIHSLRPTLGLSVGERGYVSAAYEYQRRNYADIEPRDADQHNFGLTGYYFFAPKSHLSAGYKLARETADGPEFSYWGHVVDVGVKAPLRLGNIEPVLRASYRYWHRNYSNITPSIGAERLDKRHTFRVGLEIPVYERFNVKPQYQYTDANSNLPSVDYNEHIVSLMLGWTL